MTSTITASTDSKQSPVSHRAGAVDSAIRFEQIVSRDDFASLKDEWDNLLLQSQTPTPFLSWDYLDVWWDVYGDKGFDVKLFIARDAWNKLIGVAPLMISRKGAFAGARSNFRHLSFMGGLGDLMGESLELPVMPSYEMTFGEAVADIILHSFHGQWDVLYLYLVPHDSRSTNAMINKLAEAGIPMKTLTSMPSPILPIDSSWEDYLKSRSKNRRKKVCRVISKANMKHGMKQLLVGRDISLADGYEELLRLSKARWDGGESKAFHTPAFIDFHRKLAPRLLENHSLFFGVIELDGQRAGAVYDIIFDNKMWGYQAPWDPAFSSAGVGNLLNIWSNKTAFDLGLREIDWLPGESEVKDNWSTCTRILNIYEAPCPKNFRGNIFSLARRIDRLLKYIKQS